MTHLAIAGCGGGDAATPASSAHLAWRQTGITNYQVTVSKSCFCALDGPVEITVAGGQITSARVISTGQPVSDASRGGLLTIDGLFNLLEDAYGRQAASVQFKTDPTRHFPVTVYIDYDTRMADEEVAYTLSDFKPLDP